MIRVIVVFLIIIEMVLGVTFPKKDYLPWSTLSRLSGEDIPKSLMKYNGQKVAIQGFIVPMVDDGDFERIKEFLLVPFPLACIHVPPPPPNQIVYVNMQQSIPLNIDLTGVKITGVLTIRSDVSDGYWYEMDGALAVKGNVEIEDPFAGLADDY